jgi:hypothetical protein
MNPALLDNAPCRPTQYSIFIPTDLEMNPLVVALQIPFVFLDNRMRSAPDYVCE